jgi:hypothetical protein
LAIARHRATPVLLVHAQDDIDAFIKEEACSTETLLQALTTMHG